MTAPEVTAAVERAAEALRAGSGVTHPWALSIVPRMLAAALDVEEMARAMHDWENVGHVMPEGDVEYHDLARALRTALLGPDVVWQGDGVRAVATDLVAVDDEEEGS